MGWFDKVFRASSKGPGSYDDAIRGAGFDPLDLVYPGGVITRDRAATYSAVHRAVNLITGAAASAITESLRVVDSKTSEVVKSETGRRVIDLLTESPDGVTPAYQFLEDAMTDLLVSGSAVFVIDNAITSRRLILANPIVAQGRAWEDGRVSFDLIRDDTIDGAQKTYPSSSVIIARWPRIAGRSIGSNTRTRWFGTPPIVSMRGAIALALGAEKWASAMFDRKSGAIGSDYAISYPAQMPKAAQENLHRMLEAFGAGRSPLVLDSGASVTRMGVSAQDTDLLKLRVHQVQEVGRVFGVPSILLGYEEGNTWAGSTLALEQLLLRYAVKPQLNRILSALSHRLLPAGQRLSVDEGRVFRGNAEALKLISDAARPDGNKPGLLSRNELRNLMGFDDEYVDDYGALPTAPRGMTDGDR